MIALLPLQARQSRRSERGLAGPNERVATPSDVLAGATLRAAAIFAPDCVVGRLCSGATRRFLRLAGPQKWTQQRYHLKGQQALRKVVLAVRETQLYLRRVSEKRRNSLRREERLALLWTNLSLELQDLGLAKLAKRCRITGQYWADPGQFTPEFLESAGTRLPEIEKAAQLLLKQTSP